MWFNSYPEFFFFLVSGLPNPIERVTGGSHQKVECSRAIFPVVNLEVDQTSVMRLLAISV